MKRKTTTNKIANVSLALLVSTAYVTKAMEGKDHQLAEGKARSNWLRSYEYTAEDLEALKEAAKLKAQIHVEVSRVLMGFEKNMNTYYERTGNPKKISITLPQLDTPERQYGQSKEDRKDYSERRLEETEAIYRPTLEKDKWALKHSPLAGTTVSVTTMIPETMEREITPKSGTQDKPETEEAKVEAPNKDQQGQVEKICRQTAQEKLEAGQAKVELRRQERQRQAEEARKQLAQRKADAEATKAERLNKDQQSQSGNARRQAEQDKLEAGQAKVELRRQERQRQAEEARKQLAQRKADAEATKAERLNKDQQSQSGNARRQAEQDKLEAGQAKVELRKQERQRQAEEARRQLAQRKANTEAAKAEMLTQQQQRKAEEAQEREGS